MQSTSVDGQIIFYEDYKEPLKAVPNGFGYMGTIAVTENREKIQCHICGNLYRSLGGHLRLHKTNSRDYKIEFGLPLDAALVGDDLRVERQQNAISNSIGRPEEIKKYNEKVKKEGLKHGGHKMTLKTRNKKGICPDQVLEKILDLKEKIGRTPSLDEFHEEYSGKYLSPIIYQHGSWLEAIKKLGLQSRKELRTVNKLKLLQDLVDFKEKHGRIPTTSDFKRGFLRDKNVYIRQFGTLNNARIEAGLNAILPMPFGQVVEVTPEEYFLYKEGHGRSKEALRKRAQRMKKSQKKREQKQMELV